MTFMPAMYDEKLAYTAQQERLLIGALMQPGVVGATDCLVAAGTGLASSLAAGMCAVPNTFQPFGGTYLCVNNGPVTVTHQAGRTNPRIDQVCVKVYDSANGGDSSDNTLLIVVEGTPIAGNTLAKEEGLGAVPANTLVLARVLVPTTATKTSECTFEDRRTFSTAVAPLMFVSHGSSTVAKSGELLRITGGPATITLPSATVANQLIGVSSFASSLTTIKTASSLNKIIGDFLVNVESIVLTQYQHVILQSDGSNWYIVAGEPFPSKLSDGTHPLRLQTGIFTVPGFGGGPWSMEIALPYAWPTAHVAFLVNCGDPGSNKAWLVNGTPQSVSIGKVAGPSPDLAASRLM